MKIAVLFDGAGLARLGLEQAGHDCTGFEIDKQKWQLGLSVGTGHTELVDATTVDVSRFDAVWASPPCQQRSFANNDKILTHVTNLLEWSLQLKTRFLIVENVATREFHLDQWGRFYNAAQFTRDPLQNRTRIIGGRYREPYTFRGYKRHYPGICPAILASEHKGWHGDPRRASRFYGRKLTLEECAYHQGFTIPEAWRKCPSNFRERDWLINLYEAIGEALK